MIFKWILTLLFIISSSFAITASGAPHKSSIKAGKAKILKIGQIVPAKKYQKKIVVKKTILSNPKVVQSTINFPDQVLNNRSQNIITLVEKPRSMPISSNNNSNSGGFYLGASVGAAFANLGRDQTILNRDKIGETWQYDYLKNNNYSTNFICGLYGGYEVLLKKDFLVDLSLVALMNGKLDGAGKIFLDNKKHIFDYSYSLEPSFAALLEGKIKYKIKDIFPFVIAGVGIGYNRVSKYSTQNIDTSQNWDDTTFVAHSKINFVYEIGAGLDYRLYDNSFIGISYKYLNLGKINLGAQDGTDFPYELRLGEIKIHAVTINYTYKI